MTVTITGLELLTLAKVARLGPEGGTIVRRPTHTVLDMLGLIELGNDFARITGEGLDALKVTQ